MRKPAIFIGLTLAFITGALPAFLIIMIVFADVFSFAERLFTFAMVGMIYGLIGLAFGFVLPGLSWRSGLWATIPVLIIAGWYSIQETGFLLMHFFYLALALSSACFGAERGTVLAHKRQKR